MENKDKMTAAEFREYISGNNKPKPGNKYKAKKQEIDGITFDSTAEAKRYGELKLLWSAGEITKPVLQYSFPLPGGIRYTADFVYFDLTKKEFVVEDKKGVKTRDYIMRKKLMLATHGIKIKET